MTRKQFNKITEWQEKTFPNSTEMSRVKHLIKEVYELEFDVRNGFDKSKKMEYADCIFLLFGAARKAGMDYNDIVNAVNTKFEINKNRKWGKPNADGVVNHVKEQL